MTPNKLSVVVPVLNQKELARATYQLLRDNTFTVEQDVEFIIIDNGCDEPCNEQDFPGAIIVRNEETIGVYPTFKQGFSVATGDVVAFFHSDLAVWEQNWNERVMDAFRRNERLALIGFIGSNEIDQSGGRGLGTTSNFKGNILASEDRSWQGSPAQVHGKVSDGLSSAAVVDGCAMILRRSAWEDIGYMEDFPPHHFYDRLISVQLLSRNPHWLVAVLGVACDHFSGYTTAHEIKYHKMAEAWSRAYVPEHLWVSDGNGGINWDATIYQEAERRFLGLYRDTLHFIPVRAVDPIS